jgi:hypothetical protein
MNTQQQPTDCTGSAKVDASCDAAASGEVGKGSFGEAYSLPRLFGIAAIIADTTGHDEDEEWAARFRSADRRVAELLAADREFDEACEQRLNADERDVGAVARAGSRMREAGIRRRAALAACGGAE